MTRIHISKSFLNVFLLNLSKNTDIGGLDCLHENFDLKYLLIPAPAWLKQMLVLAANGSFKQFNVCPTSIKKYVIIIWYQGRNKSRVCVKYCKVFPEKMFKFKHIKQVMTYSDPLLNEMLKTKVCRE